MLLLTYLMNFISQVNNECPLKNETKKCNGIALKCCTKKFFLCVNCAICRYK